MILKSNPNNLHEYHLNTPDELLSDIKDLQFKFKVAYNQSDDDYVIKLSASNGNSYLITQTSYYRLTDLLNSKPEFSHEYVLNDISYSVDDNNISNTPMSDKVVSKMLLQIYNDNALLKITYTNQKTLNEEYEMISLPCTFVKYNYQLRFHTKSDVIKDIFNNVTGKDITVKEYIDTHLLSKPNGEYEVTDINFSDTKSYIDIKLKEDK